MANFVAFRTKRAIVNDDFSWPFSDVRVLLIPTGVGYTPDPETVPYLVDGLADFEATGIANYARQPVPGRTLVDDPDAGLVRCVADDVTFPNLGAPGDVILGAWLIDYRFGSDDQSFPRVWLDDVGGPLDGSDFVVSFDPAGVLRIR